MQTPLGWTVTVMITTGALKAMRAWGGVQLSPGLRMPPEREKGHFVTVTGEGQGGWPETRRWNGHRA